MASMLVRGISTSARVMYQLIFMGTQENPIVVAKIHAATNNNSRLDKKVITKVYVKGDAHGTGDRGPWVSVQFMGRDKNEVDDGKEHRLVSAHVFLAADVKEVWSSKDFEDAKKEK